MAVVHSAANVLKHQPSRVRLALASNKHARCPGAGALREVRDTIVGLLREPDQAMCAECVAAALGQHVGVIMMIILGLPDRLISYHGMCSTCHRPARVVRREAPARS